MRSISQLQKEQQLKNFQGNDFRWILETDTMIKFWEDIWRQDTMQSTKHKRLYSLLMNKKIMVKEMISS